MRTIIVAALGAFGGTLGYAYILNAPKNTILPASFIGLAGYMAYVLLGMAGFGTMSAYFLSTVLVSVVCELLARKMRTPATILLLSALVPLVPGYNFYLAMLALVENRGAAAARPALCPACGAGCAPAWPGPFCVCNVSSPFCGPPVRRAAPHAVCPFGAAFILPLAQS